MRENGDEEKVQDQVMRMKKSIKENDIILVVKLIFSSRPSIVSITYLLKIVNWTVGVVADLQLVLLLLYR